MRLLFGLVCVVVVLKDTVVFKDAYGAWNLVFVFVVESICRQILSKL